MKPPVTVPAFFCKSFMLFSEYRVREMVNLGEDLFHIASLSSRTLVYKGMLLADEVELFILIEAHCHATGSMLARRILDNRAAMKYQFVKVMPKEYKTALVRLASE